MKSTEKIFNNLINEIEFPYKVQHINTRCVIFVGNQFMSKHTFAYRKSFSIPVLIGQTTSDHILYGNVTRLNTTNYQICNMQDLRYWLCSSILDGLGQLISPLCIIANRKQAGHGWKEGA